MRGIILAGGKGTRLNPLTISISKHLLPVYDKPMIYYPLSTLMLAGIKEILIISTLEDLPLIRKLLRDGSQLGVKFEYRQQDQPRGLADAFIVGKDFIGKDSVCLILGDNIFFGHGLVSRLQEAANLKSGALVFAYEVSNPERYGVIEFDPDGKAISLIEKPNDAKSNYVVPGLYFYDNRVLEYSESLQPSARGEIEITDINKLYLESGELKVSILGRGIAWLDAGTPVSLLQSANFIQAVQDRQGLMISSVEEIAYRMGFIDSDQLIDLAKPMSMNGYGEYLIRIAKGK
ncbi:MAG: glucose-1-phosphate thymidylyltransferase RfbA [Chloroflexi bacterium]|nr:glucose-1-phosphate thymidylyltransferase RfbA [Chloroflexota bacterium]